MLTLYDDLLSANGYKVRLLLQLLGLSATTRWVTLAPDRDTRQPWFLALNPLGQLPLLQDDDLRLRDSQAILVYLASRYDPTGRWYPRQDAAGLGRIGQWLAFAHALNDSIGAARRHDSLQLPGDIDGFRQTGQALLRVIDEHLWFAEQDGAAWLASAGHPTIADLACFPQIMLAEEGGLSRRPYGAVQRWCDRIKALPGFIAMPGIFAGAAALTPEA